MIRWPRRKPGTTPIAVDFGAATLKLLQLVPDEPARLFAAASKPVPPETARDPEARAAFLTKAIRELHRKGGFRGKRVIASLPAELTFGRHVRLSAGVNGVTTQQVREALNGQLPMAPERMVIRHIDVGPVATDGSAQREVICLAVARSAVMHHIDILRKAGLTPVGLHSEPVALGQAFADLFRRAEDNERTVFFVDIGLHTTKAVVSHGGRVAFAKMIQLGGDHIDRQFAEELGVEVAEARQRRREQANAAASPTEDAAPRPPTELADAGDDQADAGFSMLDTFGPGRRAATVTPAPALSAERHETIPAGGEALDCLIDELQLCVGYHRSVFPDASIEQIVFLGGEAHQSAMCRRIAESLRIPGRTADPLSRFVRDPQAKPPLGVDLRQPQPAWAVPLGLCRLPSNL